MAPTPSSKTSQMASTPSSKSNQTTHLRTPQSRHRLNFNNTNTARPSPNPNSTTAAAAAAEHPVEVIGRIRDYPDRQDKSIPPSTLQINSDKQSLRVRTDIGYRDFSLDGVSLSEEEDLEVFYKKFVESRINGVKLGDKCTIMMYGPTGSGKSHTMFGSVKQPGIVYKSLKDILGHGNEGGEENGSTGSGTFVQVTVLEIYNEEIYDLLSTNNGGGFSFGWPKGSGSKVKLEVMGKKAKNASFIAGHEAGKISKEIQKVEKRRIVKSTLCNERSSRSHCMIILDVPTVGGRLMLVDMAGSENIEQAGQNGFEAKMQTAKINQGNIALKRVVESIANGDSHVPFRDSKLTMLLQDSFEDDKSKILMILCASPDPKELHKTISTLEYGAKAKCIVRGPHTPVKENGGEDSSSAVILGSRIAVMDQFIYKLQMENKVREKERNEAQKELMKKEEEISALREKLTLVEGKGLEPSEEEINLKVNERTQKLRSELEKKIQECQNMANEIVEMERRKMEERIFQQQQEVEMLRRRLEEIESELWRSRSERGSIDVDGSSFASRLMEMYPDDSGMVKSMDLDRSIDLDGGGKREILAYKAENIGGLATMSCFNISNSNDVRDVSATDRGYLTTVYEEEDEVEEDCDDNKGASLDEEVEKEVIEEKTVCFTPENENSAASRQTRIQNIFTLCGNYRELSQHKTPLRTIEEDPQPLDKVSDTQRSIAKDMLAFGTADEVTNDTKENYFLRNGSSDDLEVYVKWEASKENPGKVITTLKIVKDSTLADLRKLVEIYLGADNQPFTFLVLGEPSGAPVPREKEATTPTTKLPICNNQLRGHLACLRPLKTIKYPTHNLPFSPLENILPITPKSHFKTQQCDGFSPELAEHLTTTPFITRRKY